MSTKRLCLIPNNGLSSPMTMDPDFPTYLVISGDFQSRIFNLSSPIYIPEFQRYPESSHKAKI